MIGLHLDPGKGYQKVAIKETLWKHSIYFEKHWEGKIIIFGHL